VVKEGTASTEDVLGLTSPPSADQVWCFAVAATGATVPLLCIASIVSTRPTPPAARRSPPRGCISRYNLPA